MNGEFPSVFEHPLKVIHLFAGAGGGILGDLILGHECVAAVEIEPFCQRVLKERIVDGALPDFPIHDDVRTFQGKPWKGKIDMISGGFPCTNISLAGKGEGLSGPQSGLWFEFARIISEAEPKFVWIENVPALRGRGLTVVLGNLHDLGYNARWGVMSAADAGAPHLRKRFWILAWRQGVGKVSGEPAAKWDSKAKSWRIIRSFDGTSISYGEAFPVWGVMRNGGLFHPPIPEFGAFNGVSWPTPRSGKVSDENAESWMKRHEEGKVSTPPLALAVKMADGKEPFPTPTKSMATVQDMEQARFAGNDPKRPKYADALNSFPTPRATDADRGGRGDLIQAVRGNANSHHSSWPTPRASQGGPDFAREDRPESGGDDLATAVAREEFGTPTANMKEASDSETWPTPTSRDWRSGKASQATLNKNSRPLSEIVEKRLQEEASDPSSWPTPRACSAIAATLTENNLDPRLFPNLETVVTRSDPKNMLGGQLNPDWVEWLMGWPIGWTNLDPLNMEWFEMWKKGTGPWTQGGWWDEDPSKTGFAPRVARDVSDRVRRLAALGNGQVPATVALAWITLATMQESTDLDTFFGW
jgi:DNA-cytosine methyltransferase